MTAQITADRGPSVVDVGVHRTKIRDLRVTPPRRVYDPGEDVAFSGILEWRDPFFEWWQPAGGVEVHLMSNGALVGTGATGSEGDFKIVHKLPFGPGSYLYRIYFPGRGFPYYWQECWSDPIKIDVGVVNNNGEPPPPGPPWEKILLYSSVGVGAIALIYALRRVRK